MSKLTGFVKSKKGIFTIVIVIAAIILIAYNWAAIKAWFILPSAVSVATQKANAGAANRVMGGASSQKSGVAIKCSGSGNDCYYRGIYVACSECAKRGLLG